MLVAFFGLGLPEIIVLVVLVLVLVALPVGVILLVVALNRRSPRGRGDALAEMREQNAELREEIERLKDRPPPPPASPENPTEFRQP